MKRITALILAVVMVLFCPFSASADGAATTFGISIYDSTAGAYLEPYCQITRALPMTYLDTMTILAERGAFLVEYDEKGWPVAIIPDAMHPEQRVNADEKHAFFVKADGILLDEVSAGNLVADGSIVEWIFMDIDAASSVSNAARNTVILWDETYAAALRESGRWLARHEEESFAYLMAVSAAGRPVSSGLVASLPSRIYREEAGDASACAQALLTLSLCGYDADMPVVSDSLKKLSEIAADPDDVLLCVQMLRAFDCRAYTLAEGAKNTREALVRHILAAQNEDGGFARIRGFDSDFEATAEAVTVLSFYDGKQTNDAVRRAISYLSAWLKADGIHASGSLSSAQVAAKLVLAMVCAGIDPRDERFFVDGKPVAAALLMRQNGDGGFAPEQGEKSELAATEEAALALAALREGVTPYLFTFAEEKAVKSGAEAQYAAADGAVQDESVIPHGMTLAGILICTGFLLLAAAFLLIRRHRRS